MNRINYLAAELHNYSYQNYDDHLGIGNVRFDKLMPDDVRNLEKAKNQGWSDDKTAELLEVEAENIAIWKQRFTDALAVVDTKSPAAGLREGLRQSLESILKEYKISDEGMASVIDQTCYRVSDFIFRMEDGGYAWQPASNELRDTPQ